MDAPVQVVAVDTQACPESGAALEPAESLAGQVCRRWAFRDSVFQVECPAFRFQVSPFAAVPARRALVPLLQPTEPEVPPLQIAHSRSQDAKNEN